MREDRLIREESAINILVVDDEEIMRNMLKDVLTEAGYRVWTAKDGEEALEKLKEADFSIVITDIRMPGMDGVEVTRKFKEKNSDICVIAITGYASIESAISILREGAYDYITKPFNIDEIRIVVSRAVERQVLLKEAKEKEKYMQLSIVDPLTEVYNRRYFEEIFPKEIERSRRYARSLSFLMIDVDDFKKFNDTQGHQAGDWALKRIAQIISGSVRLLDFVFRYGGEEFVVLLPETDKIKALVVARRLQANVANAKFLDKTALPRMHLTISIGLASFPDDAQEAKDLISKADECLYHAKKLGKNRISFLTANGEKRDITREIE